MKVSRKFASLLLSKEESLSFKVWVNEMELEVDNISLGALIPKGNKIISCDHVYKVVNYLNENHSKISITEKSVIDSVLNKLELLISDQKIEFIKEQLSLLYSKQKGRRYSKELLAMTS